MTTEQYVRLWLKGERDYTIEKFGIDEDNQHTTQWSQEDKTWWTDQLDNYYHRAGVLGLDTINGRQALAKFVATAVGMLESSVRLFGPLPEPGVPSGQNLDTIFSGQDD